jgi:hypothetical protein
MKKELYFDISSEEKGGSLFRVLDENAAYQFYYSYSTYDNDRDEIKLFEKSYNFFEEFWQDLIKEVDWFYLHPFFVHPEQRAFVKTQLENVNWEINPDRKWQESHKNQWKKILSDPDKYYRSEQ